MKNNKKKMRNTILGVLCLTCISTAFVGIATACSEQTVGLTPTPQEKPIPALPEYYETYAVGETISIRNYAWNVDGENVMLHGALIKDGETYVSVSPEVPEKNYSFTEDGKYTLVWYYVKDGVQTFVQNEEFTVGYQPYFNVLLESEYLTNETISLMAECIYDNRSFDASVKVLSPYNEEVPLSDMELTFSENGEYKVTYSAKIGEETFTRDYQIKAVGRAEYYQDYIYPVSGVSSVTGEVTAPDYIADYIDPATEDAANATGGKGVLVEMTGQGAFRYRNVVDLNLLDERTDLVKLAVLGSDGYDALTSLEIRLIDVYDNENVVAFYLNRIQNKDVNGTIEWIYTKVLYKGVTYAINSRGGMYVNSRYGIGTNVMFSTDLLKTDLFYNAEGKGSGNNAQNGDVAKATWGHFQIDYANRAFYTYTGQYNSLQSKMNQALIVDLDNPEQVGADNEWQGFTTGEVYIEIAVSAQGAKTGVILQEIAGEKLYAENNNENAPSAWFKEKTDGMLPVGIVNTFYPFADVSYSLDTIDGKVLRPDYEVVSVQRELIENLKYSEVEFEPNGFTPTSAGKYLVTYRLQDQDGNVSEQKETFYVVDDLGEKGLLFSYELPTSFMVGEYFTVPKLVKQGFSYLSEVEESIVYNGAEYAGRTNERIFLGTAGTIEFKCNYKDFLGREYSYEMSYPVTVSEKPIANMLGVVPKYAIKGSTIVLPGMTAIDYNKEVVKANSNTVWKLIVDGQELDVTERSMKVTRNHGETMKVEYVVGNDTAYSYDIKVIEANYLGDRFYTTQGDAKASTQADYISLTATNGDSTVEYINPVILDESIYGIPVKFMLDGEFESVDVYLEDYKNTESSIFVRLTQTDDGSVFAQINGEGALYPVTLTEGKYQFTYTIATKTFTFATKETIDTTSAGKDFNGFTSNLVNFRFVFNGVKSETKVDVYELSTLLFVSSYEADGVTLKQYLDRAKPLLVSEKTYRDNSMEFGSTMLIPAVEARTALSGVVTARITVTSPSGKKIIDDQNGYNDCSFLLDEYGDYKISYTVPHGLGSTNIVYTFRVYPPKLPEITLSKALAATYAGGTTLTIPEIKVSGTTEYEVKCYLVSPGYTRKKVQAGEKIQLTQYGTYRLEVVVTDELNTVYESWTFKVEV